MHALNCRTPNVNKSTGQGPIKTKNSAIHFNWGPHMNLVIINEAKTCNMIRCSRAQSQHYTIWITAELLQKWQQQQLRWSLHAQIFKIWVCSQNFSEYYAVCINFTHLLNHKTCLGSLPGFTNSHSSTLTWNLACHQDSPIVKQP